MRTVITRFISISLFTLLLFNVCRAAEEYCIPPFFDPLGLGVFTGIVNVKLDGSPALDNSTSFDDKYQYFEELPPVEIEKGKQYNLSLTFSNSQSSWATLQAKVWIDWNHDFDFDDEGEEVFAADAINTLTFEILITVPNNATIGITRMRVYEDMEPGHIAANPCGYLDTLTHDLGHHGNVEDYDIKISAAGTPQPELTLSADTLDFGGVVENQSDSLTFDISNTGTATLEITMLDLGGANRELFSIRNIDIPFMIQPGNSEKMTVIFSPASVGKFRASIYVLSSDTSGVGTIRLRGEGIAEPKPELTLSLLELDFGEIYSNQTKQMQLEIKNSGYDTLMIAVLMVKGKDADVFSLSGFDLPLNIEPGDSVTVNVEFAPTEKGNFGAQIIIGSNATEEPVVLNATGKSLGPNSVFDDNFIESLSLMPNPASDMISIKYDLEKASPEVIHLYIVDLSGNRVKSINNIPGIAGVQNLTVDIKDLPPGKYFLIIESGGEISHYPLIIVR